MNSIRLIYNNETSTPNEEGKYPNSNDINNATVVGSLGESLFSVESNSTLSSFAFNLTSKEISFGVSGPAGTIGYVKFLVSKGLVENITDLLVYRDGILAEYSVTDVGDSWLLDFTYSHSSHSIVIVFQETSAHEIEPEPEPFPPAWIAVAVVSVVAVIAGLTFYFKKRKR
jgi:hypothetical protein